MDNQPILDAVSYLERHGKTIPASLTADLERYCGYKAVNQWDKNDPNRAAKLRLEQDIQRIFDRRLKEQLKLVVDQYNADHTVNTVHLENDQAYIDELIDILMSGSEDGIDAYTQTLPAGAGVVIPPNLAADWARTYTYDLVKGIDETSISLLQGTISTFVETPGNTIGDVIEAIKPTFGEVRSSRIAITETTRAFAQGQKLAGDEIKKQFPDVEVTKQWFNNEDDLVCEICQGNSDAGEIPADELFPSGDDIPPAHVGDRCWVDYNTKLGDANE